MGSKPRVEASALISATADELYDMVSDVTRMGEWSPETTRCEWLGDADGPAVGARFRGVNAHGPKRWVIVCEVVTAERGRCFAFDATAGPIRYARWSYDFEPDGEGTRVTESVVDRRGRLLTLIGGRISGVTDRQTHNRAGIETTLANLKAAAES